MDWFLEQARLGNLFRASNQTAATITLINTSTATGFILSNSFGSGKRRLHRIFLSMLGQSATRRRLQRRLVD